MTAGRVARQAGLRASNLALAARLIFQSATPVTRADVARVTGMTKSTASRLVDELIAAGIVSELPTVPTPRRGRPGVPLGPAGGTLVALGLAIDVGLLSVRIVDLTGAVLGETDVLGDFTSVSPSIAFQQLVDQARPLLDALQPGTTLVAIHLSLPGLVDSCGSTLLRASNLRWSTVSPRFDLADAGLTEVDEVPFALSNEADCAGRLRGQTAPGRPSELGRFLYISGRGGIGSAVLHAGFAASQGWVGEFGHVSITPIGPLCACGARGCLERYAGTTALLERTGAESLDEFLTQFAAGLPAAVVAVREAGGALGTALANTLNLIDETTIVLGGDLTRLADHYRPLIEEQLEVRHLARAFVDVSIVAAPAEIADTALGAAYLGLDRVIRNPVAWVDR